jgi:hypothetical protein
MVHGVPMDYVEWCDFLADKLATYAEENQRWVHLQIFARALLPQTELPRTNNAENAIVLDAQEVVGATFNSDLGGVQFRLKHSQLTELRDRRARWIDSRRIPIDTYGESILRVLNDLSQQSLGPFVTADWVDFADVAEMYVKHFPHLTLDTEDLLERLEEMDPWGLLNSDLGIGFSRFKSSYRGIAYLNRVPAISDQQIDEIRTAGEGDTLEYKRIYHLESKEAKYEFTKDVTALANAGGLGDRYILVGVEDDGSFYLPNGESSSAHVNQLALLKAERLQEILSSRTLSAPTLTITHGQHRLGPYVMIKVNRDTAELPYRVVRSPTDRENPDAIQKSEVWIRKGTTKSLATPTEISSLVRQAETYQIARAIG